MVTISLPPETVSGNSLEDTNSVQDWKDGFGEGSFVVVKAAPKELIPDEKSGGNSERKGESNA